MEPIVQCVATYEREREREREKKSFGRYAVLEEGDCVVGIGF